MGEIREIFHYYCPNVDRLIVCILLDLIDLPLMHIRIDFNSLRSNSFRILCKTGIVATDATVD